MIKIDGMESRETLKKGAWNATMMIQSGKIHNTIRKTELLDILWVNKMSWPSTGQCKIQDRAVFYSSNDIRQYQHGVGIKVNKKVTTAILNFCPINERIMVIQITGTPININIVQGYVLTTDSDDNEMVEFFHCLSNVMKHEINLAMGDYG